MVHWLKQDLVPIASGTNIDREPYMNLALWLELINETYSWSLITKTFNIIISLLNLFWFHLWNDDEKDAVSCLKIKSNNKTIFIIIIQYLT